MGLCSPRACSMMVPILHFINLVLIIAQIVELVRGEYIDSTATPHRPIQCGIYQNELNSTMTVARVSREDATFSGYYHSAVGDARGRYYLSGHMTPSGAVAWSVAWVNREDGDSKSATTWTGYVTPETGTTLFTTWVLVSADPVQKWNRWSLGYNVFDLRTPMPC